MSTDRQEPAHDLHRPQYHFLPPANWLNDPNGLIQWNGLYHMFYQYNPAGAFHDKIHWGHAVSRDLVHWEDWPVALTPAAGDYDQDGCWSGCIVNDNGVPTLLYSGVFPQTVCLATSADNLRTWQKYPGNPVIAGPPPEIEAEGEFRDPFVWREADGWYMVIGSRSAKSGGLVLLYRSDNLVGWEYLHPLLGGDKTQTEPFWTGSIWECPNFFELGDQHVLVVSFQDHDARQLINTGYFVGSYDQRHFTPTNQALVDYGSSYYAPQVMLDAQGRRLMWGWLREGRSEAFQRGIGWCGLMSLPRVLSLDDTGTLLMTPAPELAALRGQAFRLDNLSLTPTSPNPLAEVQGDSLEILLEVELEAETVLGLSLRRTPDEAEQTVIRYDAARQELAVDTSHSSLAPEGKKEMVVVSHPPSSPYNMLRLRIFLDRSVLEIFADDRTCLTSRIYPTRSDSTRLVIFTQNGSAILHQLSIWPMKSIWQS